GEGAKNGASAPPGGKEGGKDAALDVERMDLDAGGRAARRLDTHAAKREIRPSGGSTLDGHRHAKATTEDSGDDPARSTLLAEQIPATGTGDDGSQQRGRPDDQPDTARPR